MTRLIDGKTIADRIKQQLKQEIIDLGKQYPQKKEQPNLRILSFDTPASKVYQRAQVAIAEGLGIQTDAKEPYQTDSPSRWCSWDVSPDEIAAIIQDWNQNPQIHGIFVHQPLPPQISPQWISTLIAPEKDVEGIHPQNSARRFFAKGRIGSCTALAVMELIASTGVDLEGKEAVVIGHSEIVGRPVSMLLLDKLATTTICHLGTNKAGKLEDHVRRAEILVVAAGKPKLIPGDWIRDGAIVIDVGINVVDGKVIGDVDVDSTNSPADWLSPVPGGVGPVTVMIVMRNTLEAYRQQLEPSAVKS